MSIVLSFLGLGLLILLHELGHYVVARLCGMRVIRFSIGFGPAIFKWISKSHVTWQVCIIPLGGFVQIAGMMPGDDPLEPGNYLSKPLWQRALVTAAGPLANIFLASLIYAALFASFYATHIGGSPGLSTLIVASAKDPAKSAGIQPGDIITKINETNIRYLSELRDQIASSEGNVVLDVVRPPSDAKISYQYHALETLMPDVKEYERGVQIGLLEIPNDWPHLQFTVTPAQSGQRKWIGVGTSYAPLGTSDLFAIAKLSLVEPWMVFARFGQNLLEVARGRQKASIASPIRMTTMGADLVQRGFDLFLDLLALFSINLALLNLLPLPALDGGRLFFLAIEAVARRPVPKKLELALTFLGFLLVAAISIYAIWSDLRALF